MFLELAWANIALKWVLPEPDSSTALQLLSDFAKGTHQLLAPDVFPVVAHALTLADRQGSGPTSPDRATTGRNNRACRHERTVAPAPGTPIMPAL